MEKKKNWKKGFTQVYTGNGKGKTTAALGLAFRASGAGLRTYIGQFMKGQFYNELNSSATSAGAITIEQFGHPHFCKPGHVSEEDIRLAAEGLKKVKAAISSGDFDIVVMDEVNTALYFKLLSVDDVLKIIKDKPENLELILTGRYAPEEIIEAADLATEMKELKHYYNKGVEARDGIEK